MSVPKPHWFSDKTVMVCTAPTCGISKSGGELSKYDATTGKKQDEIDDRLEADMQALVNSRTSDTLHFVPREQVSLRIAVPTYYDRRFAAHFDEAMKGAAFAGFSSTTIGALVENAMLEIRGGHGSAPKDLRVGDVPYIKVSDLRAGFVNVNPTNRVPLQWAQQMWRGKSSGLRPFDLISPERASRNIGDFCVLMPGQEQVLLTKEVIILRATEKAPFDQFYLLWALTLKIVRDQWHRVVFMQTNREDVGKRYLEISIPLPPSRQRADEVSNAFRKYFTTIAREREDLLLFLRGATDHHFFVAGAGEEVQS